MLSAMNNIHVNRRSNGKVISHEHCKIISAVCLEGRLEDLLAFYKANKTCLDMTHYWHTLAETLKHRWHHFKIPVLDSNGDRIHISGEDLSNQYRSIPLALTNTDILKYLIKAGADINVQSNMGQNLLMIATSSEDCLDSIPILIENGANLDAVDCNGFCAVAHAALHQNVPAMDVLLKHGAQTIQPNQRNSTQPVCFPLIFCIYAGSVEGINLLRHYNTMVPALSLEYLLYTLRIFNVVDLAMYDKLVSPLFVALYTCQTNIAQLFIDINFLTHFDCVQLPKERNLMKMLESCEEFGECLDIYRKTCFKPKSLFTLSFVAVSDAVGFTHRREANVGCLEIPKCLKRQLLFKL